MVVGEEIVDNAGKLIIERVIELELRVLVRELGIAQRLYDDILAVVG